jgi:hypothetical protein
MSRNSRHPAPTMIVVWPMPSCRTRRHLQCSYPTADRARSSCYIAASSRPHVLDFESAEHVQHCWLQNGSKPLIVNNKPFWHPAIIARGYSYHATQIRTSTLYRQLSCCVVACAAQQLPIITKGSNRAQLAVAKLGCTAAATFAAAVSCCAAAITVTSAAAAAAAAAGCCCPQHCSCTCEAVQVCGAANGAQLACRTHSSVTSCECRGMFICFICLHAPSSTSTFLTQPAAHCQRT